MSDGRRLTDREWRALLEQEEPFSDEQIQMIEKALKMANEDGYRLYSDYKQSKEVLDHAKQEIEESNAHLNRIEQELEENETNFAQYVELAQQEKEKAVKADADLEPHKVPLSLYEEFFVLSILDRKKDLPVDGKPNGYQKICYKNVLNDTIFCRIVDKDGVLISEQLYPTSYVASS